MTSALMSTLRRLAANEDLNFLLTNRIPRIWLTRWFGRFSQIETPWVRDLSIAVWRMFTDIDLSDARKQQFTSLHDCFTRELRAGARPVDADPAALASPCDAIVGAHGHVEGQRALQAKGFWYPLADLLGSDGLTDYYRDGFYVTLRLTSSMYHRFHSPSDWQVDHLTYLSGDTWNVNPIALKRVEALFCKNERVVLSGPLASSAAGNAGNAGNGDAASSSASSTPAIAPTPTFDPSVPRLTLVPVAAVLVASLRLHCLDVLLHLRYRGPNRIPIRQRFARGQEIGWFQHGSTIIVFAPRGYRLDPALREGQTIRMGRKLLVREPDGDEVL